MESFANSSRRRERAYEWDTILTGCCWGTQLLPVW
jgi:hypothetical protein